VKENCHRVLNESIVCIFSFLNAIASLTIRIESHSCRNPHTYRVFESIPTFIHSFIMADEIYKKVGRGGAGNFYSKQDIDNVTKSSAGVCALLLPFLHSFIALQVAALDHYKNTFAKGIMVPES
jgi:hypothetical protein